MRREFFSSSLFRLLPLNDFFHFVGSPNMIDIISGVTFEPMSSSDDLYGSPI